MTSSARPLALLPPLALALAAAGCCPAPTLRPDEPPVAAPGVSEVDAAAERAAIEETLGAFAAAVEAEDFEAAYALLSGRHRARYSVATLERDHGEAGSEAAALLDRLQAALAGGAEPLVEGEAATYPLGGGLSIGLVKEAEGWRIDRLR